MAARGVARHLNHYRLKPVGCIATGSRLKGSQARRENDALSNANARGQDNPDAADRQYPSGSKPCKQSCGAVADDRPMEDPAGVHRGQNRSA